MPADQVNPSALAEDPSLSALIFQAQRLVERLEDFTTLNYPQQTATIARILKLLAEHSRLVLLSLRPRANTPLAEKSKETARTVARFVQELYSYLRYLQASDPFLCPPGIQAALSELVKTHAPLALNCDHHAIDILVRPQWTYNLKYVDLINPLERVCNVGILDPRQVTGATDLRSLIEHLWNDKAGPPKHVAVLSFAGLDRQDALLYPLLAHELGHFFDFAYKGTIHDNPNVALSSWMPTSGDIKDLLATYGDNRSDPDIRGLHKSIIEKIQICMREITADLLAVRMVGLSYFFALTEYFKTLVDWSDQVINYHSGYPRFCTRLSLIWSELKELQGGTEINDHLRHSSMLPWESAVVEYLDVLGARLSDPEPIADDPNNVHEALVQHVTNKVIDAIPRLREVIRQAIPNQHAARVPGDLGHMVQLLEERIPPFQKPTRDSRKNDGFKGWSFAEILTAGWFYQIGVGERIERGLGDARKQQQEYQNTCALMFKALELSGSQPAIAEFEVDDENRELPQPNETGEFSGVYSGPALLTILNEPDPGRRLTICPDFGDSPIESASWDLHLGNWFRVSERTTLPSIDISDKASRAKVRREAQSERYVAYGSEFVLQPGDFALAASLEYIRVPNNLMAFVEGKSSLGRAGLVIATATQVAPGFRGCIVLELHNSGTVPIVLRPAMRIAQLVFVSTDAPLPKEWLYRGQFQVQVKP